MIEALFFDGKVVHGEKKKKNTRASYQYIPIHYAAIRILNDFVTMNSKPSYP